LKGWAVTSLSLSPPSASRKVEGVRYLTIDFTDPSAFSRELPSCEFEYVVNLGGYIDHKPFFSGGNQVISAHFGALQHLISCLSRVSLRRFIQIGSSDEYGDAPAPQHEQVREKPISPYSLAKTAASQLIQMLGRTERFPGVVLRLFLTYGPGQDESRFLPQIILGCIDDKEFPVSAGTQLRDFCHVADTVQAILSALQAPNIDGEIINIGSGDSVSIRSVIERVLFIIGSGKPLFGEVAYRSSENMALFADITKARCLLEWQPSINLHAGLEDTIAWYQQHNK
jgi:nucleoside-diphosphate-sugar epimerase